MKRTRSRTSRSADADWLRDRVEHLLLRRCRLAEAGLCPAGSSCAPLRRALDRAIVDYLALLRARGDSDLIGRRFDCPPPSAPTEQVGDAEPHPEAGEVSLGEPWLSAFTRG